MRIICALLIALCFACEARASEPFGITSPTPAWLQEKWRQALRTMDLELWAVVQCRDAGVCTPETRRVLAIVKDAQASARAYGPLAPIGRVSRAVNAALKPLPADSGPLRLRGAWMPSLESLQTGHGDCKEKVLTKLLIYRLLGMPAEDLRAVYARIPVRAQAHLVAAVRADGVWYIADNRTLRIMPDFVRARAPGQFKLNALYSLDFF